MTDSILIVRGDDTSFDDGNLATIKINTDSSLAGYSASLSISTVILTYPDVSSGEVVVNLTSTQTSRLLTGDTLGRFILYDEENRQKLVVNIPFTIVDNLPTCKASNQSIDINLINVEIIHNSKLYPNLKELPTLNGVEIIGDKTSEDYNIITLEDIEAHNTSENSHQDIRDLIGNLNQRISDLESEVSDLKRFVNNM